MVDCDEFSWIYLLIFSFQTANAFWNLMEFWARMFKHFDETISTVVTDQVE